MRGYPRHFLPLLLATLAVCAAGGLLLAPTTLAMRAEIAMPWRLPAGWRVGAAAMHSAGAYALLGLLGALWGVHMRIGWRHRHQRRSGLALAAFLLVLAASALVVLYAGDDGLANVAALVHLGLGGLLVVTLAWHALLSRTRRRRTLRSRPA